MSAYIVEDQVINSIVSFLWFKCQADQFYWTARELKKAGYLNDHEQTEKLATDMFNLNVSAVEQRYGEGQAKEFRALDFKATIKMAKPRRKVYDDLKEWQYQCSEGNIPETPLYQLMNEVYNRLAHEIVKVS